MEQGMSSRGPIYVCVCVYIKYYRIVIVYT